MNFKEWRPEMRSAIEFIGLSLRRNVVTVAITCLILVLAACGDDDRSLAPHDEDFSSSVCEDCDDSSSSEYVPFDHSKAFDGTLWRAGAYKTFIDTRNGREYYYLEMEANGKSLKVMAENLNVGDMVKGYKNQQDDSKIERYCYDNDTTNCDRYGGLYQWAEMMQLPSECNTKSCADLIQEK